MQLALCGLAEFVFHLSRLDSDMFQIACNNGQLTQTFYVFEMNQQGGPRGVLWRVGREESSGGWAERSPLEGGMLGFKIC